MPSSLKLLIVIWDKLIELEVPGDVKDQVVREVTASICYLQDVLLDGTAIDLRGGVQSPR